MARQDQSLRSLWLVCALALLVLAGVVGHEIYREHASIDAEERQQLANQSRIVDENLGQRLITAHSALESIRKELPWLLAQPNGPHLANRRLQAMVDAMVGVRTFIYMNADGDAIASNRQELLGRSFRTGERFSAIRQGGNPALLYVSAPFATPLGVYTMSIGKVVLNGQGQFGGVVLAILDPEFFKTLLNSVRYTQDTHALVAHGDGKVVYSTQITPDRVGMDLKADADSFFNQHLKRSTPAGVHSSTMDVPGQHSIVAVRTIQPDALSMDKPLVVAVSRDLSHIYAQWRRQALARLGLLGLLVTAIAVGMYFYQRRQLSYIRFFASHETERKHMEERLRQQALIFSNTGEGIVITDPQGLITEANPAFERTTEYTLDELRGKNMRILHSGRHDRSFYVTMWKTLLETGNWQGEIWNRRKSGDIYIEWISITAVYDDAGTIRNYIGTSIDMSRMNHAQSELERLAHHDALTNLPNRLLLVSRLDHALDRVKRLGGSGAVLFVDLDRFKQVNDSLGHPAGDELLKAVASRVKECLRNVDTLARMGGDEFVILLEDIPHPDAAATVAQEVVEQLAMPFSLASGHTVHIGGSIGFAIFPQDGVHATQLIERADQALYAVKSGGRGDYRRFTEADAA